MSIPPQAPPRILAVADSDSYFKFACASVDALGPGWDRRVVLARTPLLPTTEQRAGAVAGTFLDGAGPTTVLPLHRLGPLLDSADVVLGAATGPVVQELFHRVASRRRGCRRNTALVSALPGVAYPATEKAMDFRALGDLFLAHGLAEARDFSGVLSRLGSDQPVLATRLPFLVSRGEPVRDATPVDSVVFAAQAKFPFHRTDRERILKALARTHRANPGVEVIVKLRARDGEPQTHREAHPYDRLWAGLTADGAVAGDEVTFATGAMAAVLRPGTLVVTVSSTAVLEAVDRGLPAVVLTDFGLNRALYNLVFDGSGLTGSLQDVEELKVLRPEPTWLAEHYFHPPDAVASGALEQLARRARAGALTTSPEALARTGRMALHHRLRTRLPRPLLRLVRGLPHRRFPARADPPNGR
ncbi:DUF6716 putative glycosyltransferase [Arthrobacter sp. AOP36-A1-22]|uniref:DUF6716 putative glycosyltransferase n=1 Tax=unclassified Arthrobacter TaxID=235627 RepID=UPI004034480A